MRIPIYLKMVLCCCPKVSVASLVLYHTTPALMPHSHCSHSHQVRCLWYGFAWFRQFACSHTRVLWLLPNLRGATACRDCCCWYSWRVKERRLQFGSSVVNVSKDGCVPVLLSNPWKLDQNTCVGQATEADLVGHQ